jgi:hypothetical protein
MVTVLSRNPSHFWIHFHDLIRHPAIDRGSAEILNEQIDGFLLKKTEGLVAVGDTDGPVTAFLQ